MIHYIGKLQRTPGRRACQAKTAQAETTSWHATDCRDCKVSLVGLDVRWAGIESTPGARVREVLDGKVVVRWVGGGEDRPSLYEFENCWELAP